ncbi:hypothetical protein LBMAG53_14590 [Planctomycetota bacterium]|nr:hypothetical protein LBMAG53_14590 [Planctomycetota bacterium]
MTIQWVDLHLAGIELTGLDLQRAERAVAMALSAAPGSAERQLGPATEPASHPSPAEQALGAPSPTDPSPAEQALGAPSAADLVVRLVDDAESARLHGEHFSDPTPTDVMTFPDGSHDPASGRLLLGDLAIGIEVARRVAAARGRRAADEVVLYVLHGALHLLGYDDHEPADLAAMWAEQRRILAEVGIDLEPTPQD